MKPLVDFVLGSIALHPDQVQVNAIEGQASILFEVSLHDEDKARLQADDRALLGAVQAVLSASSGRRKAVIDLIDAGASSEEE